jgi:lysophospholipase L1-like esterase
MKLDFQTIKTITIGTARIWESDGVYNFCKMTQKQIDAFYVLSDFLGKGAEATTGIRLDFYTNSKTFAFTPANSGRYEVKINGFLVNTKANQGEKKTFELEGEENRVTLYLPSHSKGVLESVEIDDGACVKPCNYDFKMLMIGDSITQGWNSGIDSLSYAYIVSENLNANTVIQGIGGAFYDLTTIDKIDFAPDVITVAYGTNDANRVKDLDNFTQVCENYLNLIKENYPNARVIVITPITRLDNEENKAYGNVRLVDKVIKECAERLGLEVICGMKMLPQAEEFMNDNLHPNGFGFSIYGKNLTAELKSRLN